MTFGHCKEYAALKRWHCDYATGQAGHCAPHLDGAARPSTAMRDTALTFSAGFAEFQVRLFPQVGLRDGEELLSGHVGFALRFRLV